MKRLLSLTSLSALFVVLVLFPLTARAHGGEGEAPEPEGYEITLSPQEAIQNDELPIAAHILREGLPLRGAAVTLTVDRHEEGISDRLEAKEREPGSYAAVYRFETSGEYEVHIEFVDSGATKRVTRNVRVLATSWFTAERAWGIGTFGLAVAALAIGLAKRRWRAGVGAALALLAAGGISYSLYVTFQSGAASTGVVTCVKEGECYLTAHIHAYIPITLCGKEFRLPIETGALTGPHTHEEKNIAHWHDRLPYDNVLKQPKDVTPFTLDVFFKAVHIPFDIRRIGTARNGDLCEGKSGTVKMFVNGIENSDYERYVWKDHDVIAIIFDSRMPEAIEAELKAHPILFPALGRG